VIERKEKKNKKPQKDPTKNTKKEQKLFFAVFLLLDAPFYPLENLNRLVLLDIN
jgi:hypothetical protein